MCLKPCDKFITVEKNKLKYNNKNPVVYKTIIFFLTCFYRFHIRQHTDGRIGSDPGDRDLHPAVTAEPTRWPVAPQALDNDWGSSPVAAGREKHGVPEVLQYGAESVHQDGPAGSALCGTRCARTRQTHVRCAFIIFYNNIGISSYYIIITSLILTRFSLNMFVLNNAVSFFFSSIVLIYYWIFEYILYNLLLFFLI